MNDPAPPDPARLREDFAARADEVRETHGSWVFLDAERAVKVKKPVDFGFLDFSTADKRRAACEAELKLNRRLSPDVYERVAPVTRDDTGAHALDGEGDVVDWAVVMTRLPDAHRADQLLQQGALTHDHVALAARRIAAFHADCRSDEETARFGAPAAIEGNVRENFEQSADASREYVTDEEAAEIERAQLAELSQRAGVFEARAADGRVRDGHGDLRLEHLYFEGDVTGAADDVLFESARVRVLDCIEFNDRFRYGDVASDVAFLAMDLAFHGHAELAEFFLARYAMESGDFDLYGVVDFYESYRAYVRAKIATFVAGAPDTSHDERERHAAQARRYFLLALASERRPPLPPFVVAMGGYLAAGKSTLAARLSREVAAPVVMTDLTRKQLLGAAPTANLFEEFGGGAYTPEFSERVYGEVERRAAAALSAGRPVFLDGSYRSRAARERARDLARDLGVPFLFVECRAPEDVCRARLADRDMSRSISDGRLEIFDSFVAGYEEVNELAPDEHVRVDTTRPLDEVAAEVRARLPAWPPELGT